MNHPKPHSPVPTVSSRECHHPYTIIPELSSRGGSRQADSDQATDTHNTTCTGTQRTRVLSLAPAQSVRHPYERLRKTDVETATQIPERHMQQLCNPRRELCAVHRTDLHERMRCSAMDGSNVNFLPFLEVERIAAAVDREILGY